MENIDYVFPSQSIGGAIRLQLEGLQTLHLFKFQVYIRIYFLIYIIIYIIFLIFIQAFQGDQILIEPPPMNFTSSNGLPSDLPYPDFINDGDAQIRYDTFASYPPQLFKSQSGTNKLQKSGKKKTNPVPMLNRISESVWKLNTKVTE